MLNSICAPEMSFNSGQDNEPHAYVCYEIDGEKETIPVSHIYNFPKTWRTDGYRKQYLYHVFWSPDMEDSPAQMLKRMPEIQFLEGKSMKDPGFYRAAVIEVGETLRDLEAALERKRPSIPSLSRMEKSFDGSKRAKVSAGGKTSVNPNQPVVKKSKATKERKDRSTKAGELNAQLKNTSDLSDELRDYVIKKINNPTNSKVLNNDTAVKLSKKLGQSPKGVKAEIAAKDTKHPNKATSSETASKMARTDKFHEAHDHPTDSIAHSESPGLNSHQHNYLEKAISKKRENMFHKQTLDDVSSKSLRKLKSFASEPVSKHLSQGNYKNFHSEDKEHPKATSSETSSKMNCSDKFLEAHDHPTDSIAHSESPGLNSHQHNYLEKAVSKKHENVFHKQTLDDVSSKSPRKLKSFASEPVSKHLSQGVASKRRRRKLSTSSDSTVTSVEIDHKKVQVDPDFTPRKYHQAQSELNIFKSSNKRVLDLNFKLQEIIISLESKITSLTAENDLLKDRIKLLEKDFRNSEVDSKSKNLKSTERTEETGSKTTEPCWRNSIIHVSPLIKTHGFHVSPLSKQSSTAKRLLTFSDDSNPKAKEKCENSGRYQELEEDFPFNDEANPDETHNTDAAYLCQPVILNKSTDGGDDVDENEDTLVLCPEALPILPHVRKIIFSLRTGERKDLQFLKDLTLAAIGPEILASHSIKGTKRGGKKSDVPKVKKEALNSSILNAVREKLIKRVAEDLGVTSEKLKADGHERIALPRFYSAIRDLQKKLRIAGYGNGSKANTVCPDMFKESNNNNKLIIIINFSNFILRLVQCLLDMCKE